MPLSSIVTIVLRLYSLLWLVQGASMFVAAIAMLAPEPFGHPNYWSYAGPAFMVFAAVVTFVFSQPIARIVTPPPNPELSLGGLSQYDLYCFAFTFLGLYFVLSSIASTINWLHYFFVIARSTKEGDPQRLKGFYDLSRSLITFAAGAASLMFAPRLARKLTAIQRKSEDELLTRAKPG